MTQPVGSKMGQTGGIQRSQIPKRRRLRMIFHAATLGSAKEQTPIGASNNHVDNARARGEPPAESQRACLVAPLLAFSSKRAQFAATAADLLDGGDRPGLQEEEVANLIECPLDVLRASMNFLQLTPQSRQALQLGLV